MVEPYQSRAELYRKVICARSGAQEVMPAKAPST
jgi:hypothetical protein